MDPEALEPQPNGAQGSEEARGEEAGGGEGRQGGEDARGEEAKGGEGADRIPAYKYPFLFRNATQRS